MSQYLFHVCSPRPVRTTVRCLTLHAAGLRGTDFMAGSLKTSLAGIAPDHRADRRICTFTWSPMFAGTPLLVGLHRHDEGCCLPTLTRFPFLRIRRLPSREAYSLGD